MSERLDDIIVGDLGDSVLDVAEVAHKLAQGFFFRLLGTVEIIFRAGKNVCTLEVSPEYITKLFPRVDYPR